MQVTVSANACGTGWKNPAAGLTTFQVRNATSNPVEVALIDAPTSGVYAEIDAIAPGKTAPMQVNVGSGAYAFQCDSNAFGLVTGPTTRVPGSVHGTSAVLPPSVVGADSAVAGERAYVLRGLSLTAGQAAVLDSDIRGGNLMAARSAWLTAHLSFERLGSAYGMFGDYDDEIDGTADGLRGGVNDPSFAGFHRIEYGLWHNQSAAQLTGPADNLVSDLRALRTAYPGMVSYPQAALSDLALRTHEIMEHAIRFQLSGADDYGSGTTLATMQANIDATTAQLGMLKPLLSTRYPSLPAAYAALARLRALVSAEKTPSGWIAVSTLTDSKREALNSAGARCAQLLAPIAVMFESSPTP